MRTVPQPAGELRVSGLFFLQGMNVAGEGYSGRVYPSPAGAAPGRNQMQQGDYTVKSSIPQTALIVYRLRVGPVGNDVTV